LDLSVTSWRSFNLAASFFFIVRMEISLLLWKIFVSQGHCSVFALRNCQVAGTLQFRVGKTWKCTPANLTAVKWVQKSSGWMEFMSIHLVLDCFKVPHGAKKTLWISEKRTLL
jgi:hypothetical protein